MEDYAARAYDVCMAFQLTSEAFADGAPIPKRHTCEDQDVSPALAWSGEPDGTRSFALIMDDPDAPLRTWNHWLLWDIPADTHALKERFRPSAAVKNGTNDFGKPGYGGPCPPRGHGPHRYVFQLFALNRRLAFDGHPGRSEVIRTMKGHVLAKGVLVGTYERR